MEISGAVRGNVRLTVITSLTTGNDVEKKAFGAANTQGNAEAVLGQITP